MDSNQSGPSKIKHKQKQCQNKRDDLIHQRQALVSPITSSPPSNTNSKRELYSRKSYFKKEFACGAKFRAYRYNLRNSNIQKLRIESSYNEAQESYAISNESYSPPDAIDESNRYLGSTLLYKTFNGPKAAPLSPDYEKYRDPCYGFNFPMSPSYIPTPIWSPMPAIPVPITSFPYAPPPVYPMVPFIPTVSPSSPYSTCYLNNTFNTFCEGLDQTIDTQNAHSSFDGDLAIDQTYAPAEIHESYNSHNFSHDTIQEYLHVYDDQFPNNPTYDPILLVDAFCATNLETNELLWLLDLEFGYDPRCKRPVPVYDVQSRIIITGTGATHPGYDKCEEYLKQVLMFYYDSIVSSWYLGFMAYYGDKSVLRFQSWLDEMLLRDGMNWMSRCGNNFVFPPLS